MMAMYVAEGGKATRRRTPLWLLVGLVLTLSGANARAQSSPEGQLRLGLSFTIAPTYLDPSEATQVVALAFFLYALHDALVKALPGNPMAPALAESWTESPDGLAYEFVLRQGPPSTMAIRLRPRTSNLASSATKGSPPSSCTSA